jgi:hypothetical protein
MIEGLVGLVLAHVINRSIASNGEK